MMPAWMISCAELPPPYQFPSTSALPPSSSFCKISNHLPPAWPLAKVLRAGRGGETSCKVSGSGMMMKVGRGGNTSETVTDSKFPVVYNKAKLSRRHYQLLFLTDTEGAELWTLKCGPFFCQSQQT